jgi:hypothetical protein
MREHLTKCSFLVISVAFLVCVECAPAQDHLSELDSVRTSLTDIGYKLPDAIKSAKPEDVRTLERVFEINNYALMTIESYLKMLKVFSLGGAYINKDIVNILNGWLKFIDNYCEYDIKYLDEAKSETKDSTVLGLIDKERSYIASLKEAAIKGSIENSKILSE